FAAAEELESLDEGGHGPRVRVAGRLVAWRGHGKTAFAHIEDRGGRMQLYFRQDVLGEPVFGLLHLVDLGGWVGIEGPLFRPRARSSRTTTRSTAGCSCASRTSST